MYKKIMAGVLSFSLCLSIGSYQMVIAEEISSEKPLISTLPALPINPTQDLVEVGINEPKYINSEGVLNIEYNLTEKLLQSMFGDEYSANPDLFNKKSSVSYNYNLAADVNNNIAVIDGYIDYSTDKDSNKISIDTIGLVDNNIFVTSYTNNAVNDVLSAMYPYKSESYERQTIISDKLGSSSHNYTTMPTNINLAALGNNYTKVKLLNTTNLVDTLNLEEKGIVSIEDDEFNIKFSFKDLLSMKGELVDYTLANFDEVMDIVTDVTGTNYFIENKDKVKESLNEFKKLDWDSKFNVNTNVKNNDTIVNPSVRLAIDLVEGLYVDYKYANSEPYIKEEITIGCNLGGEDVFKVRTSNKLQQLSDKPKELDKLKSMNIK